MWTVLLILSLCGVLEAQNFYVVTPRMIRLGVNENIALAVDGTSQPQTLDITIYDYPGLRKNVFSSSYTVNPSNPKIVQIKLNPRDMLPGMLNNPNVKPSVRLTAVSGAFKQEAILPISFKSGYVFIQTDKPIYTPKERVEFRVIQLNEDGKPSRDEIRFQIKNPKNMIVQERVYNSGKQKEESNLFITPKPYAFQKFPIFGRWSATVLYGYQFQQNVTVGFELREYVLPTFKVTLTTQDVILPTHKTIHFSVEARHVYGKPVKGIVNFRLGIKNNRAAKAVFFTVLDTNQLQDGVYNTSVSTEALRRYNSVEWFPEGSYFVVEATVTETATGKKETAVDEKGRFSKTPFVISFDRSLSDFKPGLVSIIQGNVYFVDGQPAKGIKTVLTKAVANKDKYLKVSNNESVSSNEGTIMFEIHPETDHEEVSITVETADPIYRDARATGHHTQWKFKSKNKAYIAIQRRQKQTYNPGEPFSVPVHMQPSDIKDVYYLVISKGKILFIKKLQHGKFVLQNINFLITHSMVPSFRLVAFGEYNGELIADSVKIDVVQECDPSAEVVVLPEFNVKKPGSLGKIVVKGRKDTRVALIAVDSAVYALSDKDLLTKSKMFRTMEEHDLGCGPGGGLETSLVLINAGIHVMTNNFKPDANIMTTCEGKRRRKREVTYEKLNLYQGRLRACCAFGLQRDLYGRPCSQRADIVKEYLQENDRNCSYAFLECCMHSEMENISLLRMGTGSVQTPRMGQSFPDIEFLFEDEQALSEVEKHTRNDFRETWIVTDLTIRHNGQAEVELTLPHSITTWVIQAVSVSESHGMCVSQPKEIQSFKDVFLQLNLPYSVVRNEQIEIPATLYNYGNANLSAIVYMYGVKDLCTGAQEGERSEHKRMVVESHSAQTVSFPVIPLKEGIYDINVVAWSFQESDSIMQRLNVVPEGEVVEKDVTLILDPSNQQRRKKRDISNNVFSDSIDEDQKLQISAITLDTAGAIPGTESCVISALGDQFGPTVETSLENPEKLLEKPRGCGEQNMIYFAPTLYTMQYLKETGQITPEKEAKGYDLMRQGYSWQLSYRKDDGSFGAYINTPSSTWLTAFVTRVFCQASSLIHVDEGVMCSGVKWILDRQEQDGSFIEKHPVYHKEMMGGVKGQTPLTAFILIMLEECHCDFENIRIKRARAMSYLEDHLGEVNEPLPLAVVAYSLALSESELKHAANNKLLSLGKYEDGSNTLYWETGSSAGDIEATGYGLLTQLKFNDMEKCNSIVNWLNRKRLASGSFESTQDTVVALHALSEYAVRSRSPGISLVSNITSSNDLNYLKTMAFHDKNSLILQEIRIDNLGDMLFIKTAGHGVGLMTVKLRYNILRPAEELCKFEIKVNVTQEKEDLSLNSDSSSDPVKSHDVADFELLDRDLVRSIKSALDAPPEENLYDIDPRNRAASASQVAKPPSVMRSVQEDNVLNRQEEKPENSKFVSRINICVKYLENLETEMVIVDVGIFSGFKPYEEDLKKLEKTSDLIDKYEISGRGVFFYLSEAPSDKPYCFSFRIIRQYLVGNVQPTSIKVYDFYNPNKSCAIFYSPDQNSPLLRKICSGAVCQCAEGGCPPNDPFAKTGKNREKLKLSACEDYDYVWKGKVVGPVQRKGGLLYIPFKVDEVLKEGVEKTVDIKEDVRLLMARENCESAELVPDQEYVIMGKDGEEYEDEKKEIRRHYLLDKAANIFKWHREEKRRKVLSWLSRKLKVGCDY